MSGIFSNQKLKDDIKSRFYKFKNVDEFVLFLNYFERQTLSEDVREKLKPLTKKQLYHLSKTSNSRYFEFQIHKKNGNNRDIYAPDLYIKRLQKSINLILQIIFENTSSNYSNGFLIGKDICRNAVPHINKNLILNLDLENFFPSIQFRRIKTVLELDPFLLKGSREPVAFLISNICTLNGILPQGSPASPILSNIVTQRLDRKLARLSSKRNIKYSRYADDLTFSSNLNILDEGYIKKVSSIIKNENFKVNSDKTRVRNSMERQEVTGLIVNQKLNVKRKYLQITRAMLNNWEKGGLRFAENEFKKHQPINKWNYDFREVLLGRLSFIKLVKGDIKLTDKLLLKYFFLFNQINYDHIRYSAVKNRLRKDNIKMEKLLADRSVPTDDLFISFCTIAFHQIENLINYYYFRKFDVFENLLETLIKENPSFKSRYKTVENAKKSFKQIKDLNINVLVYLYEKEFFFDKDLYYNQEITNLREIRNDESHRCQVINIDTSRIVAEYESLQERISNNKKRNKNYGLSRIEKKLISNYQVLKFLEKKKFKEARKTVFSVNENIKNYFTKNKLSEIID